MRSELQECVVILYTSIRIISLRLLLRSGMRSFFESVYGKLDALLQPLLLYKAVELVSNFNTLCALCFLAPE